MTLDIINDGFFEAINQSIDAGGNSESLMAPSKSKERKMKHPDINLDTEVRQMKYVAERKAAGGLKNIVSPEAFIRGMRDLGYKDPSWAMAELIDNAIQAGSTKVEVRFGFDGANASQAKNPAQIAIIDDGTGMHSEMLPYAVEWGGTDRWNERDGFGRYGYGLPSSCISIACRYTVYSKVSGGTWHAVTVDINEIVRSGSNPTKIASLLASKPVTLPKWLAATPENGVEVADAKSGTIIVLEDLDRLRKRTGWILIKSLRDRLLKQFGLIYRHWLTDVKIIVDGASAQAVDPLFLLEHARLVDETSVRAKKAAERTFDVTTDDGKTGTVRIRAALLPPEFSWADPSDLTSGGKKNKRWEQVLAPKNQLNGLLLCREGRQIDVLPPDWTKFQNNDAYIKIEIDFDPVLDEYFNITTSKQQVRIDEAIWTRLAAAAPAGGGLDSLVKEMRAAWNDLNDKLKADVANASKDNSTATELPAATAMQAAEKFRVKTPRISDKARAEARRNLEAEVEAQAKSTGKPVEQVREKLEEVIKKRPWDMEFQALEEGPFYIPKRLGDQKRIILNTAHPFYSRLYSPASPSTKSALEVLLFVLADGEVNADDQHVEFYRDERGHRWTPMLKHALSALVPQSELSDSLATAIEQDELAGQDG